MSVTTPPRGFPDDEFEVRTDRAQKMMAEQGMAALLLTTEPEIRYFTGFLTLFWQSPTRPWFLVVPAQGKPVAVIPGIGAALMRKTWIDDVRTWSSPHPTDDGVTLLADTLKELAGTGPVGLAMGPETHIRMPLSDFARLKELAGIATFRDATDILKKLRHVKSEREIAKIAHICSIASSAFEAAPRLFHEGQPLSDVFRAFRKECLDLGADDVPYLVGGAGQGGYDDVISPPDETPLNAGDVLMLDTGATFDGYYCDFDRNYAIGHADDAAKKAYRTLHEATEAAIRIARPGVRCRDLFNAMQTVISEAGGGEGDVGRYGHGLGMQLTEWPSHTAFDETVLEANTVITLEPGMSISPGKIMVHEENLVIREDGIEMLSRRAAPELPVIG